MRKILMTLAALFAVSVLVPNTAISEIEKKVKVSTNDTTAGYLNGKVVCGSNLTCIENNDGGNESLQLNAVSSGTGVVLDIADDNANESTGIAEIATVNDTYAIFYEPSADKLLINVGNKWPLSQQSVSFQSNGANCSSGYAPLGIDASGAVESCFDVATQSELNSHATQHNIGGSDTLTFYGRVQDEAGDLTQRQIINFTGAGITCVDNGGSLRTDCTVTAGVTDHGALTGLSDDDHAQYMFLAGRTGGQTLIGGLAASENLTFQTTSNATKGKYRFSELINCDTIDTDASGNLQCGTDATGSGGSPLYLDLGDDSGNESIDLQKLATSGDTNSIFTEPVADKLLVDLTKNWPEADNAVTADSATALAANGTNCSSGEWAAGVDASGNAEGCTADDDSPDSDSEVPNDLTVNLQDNSTAINGASPTVDTAGEFAIDTTSNQWLYYSNSAIHVVEPVHTLCATIPDVTSADDNFQFWAASKAVTVKTVFCRYEGTGTTKADFALEDAEGNAMTHSAPVCVSGASTPTAQTISAGGGLVAGEGLRFDVTNTPDPATDDYTLCLTYTVTRD